MLLIANPAKEVYIYPHILNVQAPCREYQDPATNLYICSSKSHATVVADQSELFLFNNGDCDNNGHLIFTPVHFNTYAVKCQV